jgi:hypothetical protein
MHNLGPLKPQARTLSGAKETTQDNLFEDPIYLDLLKTRGVNAENCQSCRVEYRHAHREVLKVVSIIFRLRQISRCVGSYY